MKYSITILLLFFILFSSCEKKEKAPVVINPELLEGYWVSGYLLHNTELTRSLSRESGKEPGIELLRLKNEVNGYPDTSYSIRGDILVYRIKAGVSDSLEYNEIVDYERNKSVYRESRIVFLSKDRLVLADKINHEESTYYNLEILKEEKQIVSSITIDEMRMNFHLDSVFIGSRNVVKNNFLLRPIQSDKKWIAELNTLSGFINWKNALLFSDYKRKPITLEEIDCVIVIRNEVRVRIPFQLKTNRHFGIWSLSGAHTSDPALNALMIEMEVWKMYCYNHEILPNPLFYDYCGTGLPEPDYINREYKDEYETR